MKLLLILCLSLFLNAHETKKEMMLYAKGEKIYKIMCDKKVLKPLQAKNQDELKIHLKESLACGNLKEKDYEALSLFYFKKFMLKDDSLVDKKKYIKVPSGAKCSVCGMFVYKYPKWAAVIELKNKDKKYFDGVKDMMKYYLFPDEYYATKDDFKVMYVTDYYTLEALDAKKAWYVSGSNVYGPMGHELIPFRTKKDAQNFKKTHFAKEIMNFNAITKEKILNLE